MFDVLKFLFFSILLGAVVIYMKFVPTVVIIGATLFGGYVGYRMGKEEGKRGASLFKSTAFMAAFFFVASFLLMGMLWGSRFHFGLG